MRIIPRPRDKIVWRFIKKNYKKGDCFTRVEISRKLKNIGKSSIGSEIKWMVNLGYVRRLDVKDWKEWKTIRKNGIKFKRVLPTFKLVKNL